MFLDFVFGALISIIVGLIYGDLNILLILFGVFASIAPDMDLLIYSWKKRKIDHWVHEHRDIFHHPIIFTFTIGAVIYFISPAFGIVWILSTLWHFVHDTYRGGWGIKWLSPFCGWYFSGVPYCERRIIKTKEEQRKIVEEKECNKD